MTENAIVQSGALMPALSIQEAVQRYNTVMEFTRTVMKEDKDYGIIPGTGTKATLLKPGAEKLCSLFGLSPKFVVLDKILDFERGLFYFQYDCQLYDRRGNLVGSGIGSCNSREKKYRYRSIPEFKASEEEKALAVRRETRTSKKGNQYTVLVLENQEPFDLVNTLDKMAQKRSLIAAVLIAANASEFFTQDIEDIETVDGEYRDLAESPPGPADPPAPAKRKSRNPAPANGDNPVAWLQDAGAAPDGFSAAGMLKLSPWAGRDKKEIDKDALIAWGKLYRVHRDEGLESEEAAQKATAEV